MARSVLLERVLPRTVASWEASLGRDGQGAPSYAAAVPVEVIYRQMDEEVVGSDGSTVKTHLRIWVPADQTPVAESDRLTLEGVKYIGVEVKEVRTIGGKVSHHRMKLRKEKRGT